MFLLRTDVRKPVKSVDYFNQFLDAERPQRFSIGDSRRSDRDVGFDQNHALLTMNPSNILDDVRGVRLNASPLRCFSLFLPSCLLFSHSLLALRDRILRVLCSPRLGCTHAGWWSFPPSRRNLHFAGPTLVFSTFYLNGSSAILRTILQSFFFSCILPTSGCQQK